MQKYLILNILLSLSILSFAQSGSFNITGKITCQSGDGMENVNVALTQNGQLVDSLRTDQNGDYQFLNLPIVATDSSYQVEVFYVGQPLDGVSTFDMVVAMRHILGIDVLSPAQVLAADLNRSGSLTTLDLVQMRVLILFLPQAALVPNPDWLFYREVNGQIQERAFAVPGNSGNQTLNIQGIKRGDLNGSAVCGQ